MTRQSDALTLSELVGEYREAAPAFALNQHFRCIWTNTLKPECESSPAVVPDGHIDLMWMDGELVVAGPDIAVCVPRLAPDTTVLGFQFRPGAASKWLGLPMSEIVGRRESLDCFWGVRARQLGERMREAASLSERRQIMESTLARRACEIEPPGSALGFVFNALKTDSSGRGMSIILERLDISPRTLRRRCQDAFGYGPKTLERILRFQRFLRLTRRAQQPKLSALAFEAGYSDQAHLTREVRSLSGFSPAMILSQLARLG